MVMRRECSDRFLADKGDEVMLYRHHGFWQCRDAMRDWELLNELWAGGNAPRADAR